MAGVHLKRLSMTSYSDIESTAPKIINDFQNYEYIAFNIILTVTQCRAIGQ